MRRSINLKLDTYTYLLLGFLVVILLLFTMPTMLWKLESWQSMAMQMPEYGVMTPGVMLCFIAGCIDVSFVALGDLASIFGVMFIIKMTADNASTGNVVLAIWRNFNCSGYRNSRRFNKRKFNNPAGDTSYSCNFSNANGV